MEAEFGAVTRPRRGDAADSSSVLFRYDQSTGAWSVIEYGSSMTCTAVPAEVVGHLPYCFSG
ncbi:hypothetical protein [Actinospica robiniae]|uniref:hypothetical protein n=1 Tax=Actinospica robiniae TaxID=304901 RepID=UPI00041537CE|nr:hypothetical protein [Actinospica robiniae]